MPDRSFPLPAPIPRPPTPFGSLPMVTVALFWTRSVPVPPRSAAGFVHRTRSFERPFVLFATRPKSASAGGVSPNIE